MIRIFTIGLLTLSLLMIGCGGGGRGDGSSTSRQPGALDSSFGTDGKVTTSLGTNYDNARAIAIQTDGSIVVAGSSVQYSVQKGNQYDFALARYTDAGALDPTFGTNGKVITAFGLGAESINTIAIQADGKILAAGYSFNGSNKEFALARYTSEGVLDTTFGTNGKVTTPFGANWNPATAMALQSDGKIVVAACVQNGSDDDFGLVRYTTEGLLDGTFGTGGKVITSFGTGNDEVMAIAIQQDGKIIAAGYSNGIEGDFALARYTSEGELDITFGIGGKVTTNFGGSYNNSYDYAYAIAIQADGKIVVTGATNYDFGVARYTAEGALDVTFGNGGKVTTSFSTYSDLATSIAIQTDGKIIATGYTFAEIDSTDNFALARYTNNGALDTTFGMNGKVTTSFGSGNDFIQGIAIGANGKIVAAGYTFNGTDDDFALACYFP